MAQEQAKARTSKCLESRAFRQEFEEGIYRRRWVLTWQLGACEGQHLRRDRDRQVPA